jgi:hypothetical protein
VNPIKPDVCPEAKAMGIKKKAMLSIGRNQECLVIFRDGGWALDGNFPFEVTVFGMDGFLSVILTQGLSLTRLFRFSWAIFQPTG